MEWLQHGGLILERFASNWLMCLSRFPHHVFASGIHTQVRVNDSAIHTSIPPSDLDRDQELSRYSQQEEVEENLDAIVPVAEQSDTNFKNKLTVLFSAPLCCRLQQDSTLIPIDVLDFERERDLLFNCFREASQDIDLEFDIATTERLSACLSKRCTCLHYSGHGHPSFLTFEDGKGGLHAVKVDNLKQSLVSGDGSAPFQFVFVSACHSKSAGQAFVDAGK